MKWSLGNVAKVAIGVLIAVYLLYGVFVQSRLEDKDAAQFYSYTKMLYQISKEIDVVYRGDPSEMSNELDHIQYQVEIIGEGIEGLVDKFNRRASHSEG